MYAVIETGGKQYRVEVGTELEVELLAIEPGSAMTFDRVLLVADGETAAIGRPTVANASVAATVVGHDRGEKVISFKYRPKARRRVKKGHRQELTLLKISDIVLDGHSAAADVREADAERQRDRAKLEEAARRQAAADAELARKLAAEKSSAAEAPKGRSRGTTTSKAAGSTSADTTPSAKAEKADTSGKAEAASKATASKADATASATTKRAPAKRGGSTSTKIQASPAKPAKPRTKKES